MACGSTHALVGTHRTGVLRARIANLSPFDKVVGGMCWSITASNVVLSVDILFQENSTIGEKIKLSENLVKALLQMKCPLAIQSHQIQGLDYDNIFPVLQWLVRRVPQHSFSFKMRPGSFSWTTLRRLMAPCSGRVWVLGLRLGVWVCAARASNGVRGRRAAVGLLVCVGRTRGEESWSTRWEGKARGFCPLGWIVLHMEQSSPKATSRHGSHAP